MLISTASYIISAFSGSKVFQPIILMISKRSGGPSKDENRITGRLAPATTAINAITLPAIIKNMMSFLLGILKSPRQGADPDYQGNATGWRYRRG